MMFKSQAVFKLALAIMILFLTLGLSSWPLSLVVAKPVLVLVRKGTTQRHLERITKSSMVLKVGWPWGLVLGTSKADGSKIQFASLKMDALLIFISSGSLIHLGYKGSGLMGLSAWAQLLNAGSNTSSSISFEIPTWYHREYFRCSSTQKILKWQLGTTTQGSSLAGTQFSGTPSPLQTLSTGQ